MAQAVYKRGALVIFLEPYDPMSMPVEIAYRHMKKWLQLLRDFELMPKFMGADWSAVFLQLFSQLVQRAVTHEQAIAHPVIIEARRKVWQRRHCCRLQQARLRVDEKSALDLSLSPQKSC